MKTLLIVEDEKHIRQGLVAMAGRAPVEIERIISCANGEEALEILDKERVDVMITDIRMPKMDGLTLVKRIQALKHVPLSVVVSGYDDFSYAVEGMRSGVRDYILKPVERDQLAEVLKKLDEELASEEQQASGEKMSKLYAMRYLMLDDNIPQKDYDLLIEQYSSQFFEGEYRAICVNWKSNDPEQIDDALVIRDMEHQTLYITSAEKVDNIIQQYFNNRYVGVSTVQNGIETLHTAYEEALRARKTAFLQSRRVVACPMLINASASPDIPEREIDQIVQMLGASRWQECRKVLMQLIAQASSGAMSGEAIGAAVRLMTEKITSSYQNLAPLGDELATFTDLWAFGNAPEFIEHFSEWMRGFAIRLETEFEDYQNKQKIQQAVQYVRENFASGLNMAIVSNHVSMNYSLFSLLFKQYTGANFVNYLQNLRVEESKRLLRETDCRVSEISHRTGFQDEKHFMKVFKNIMGVSPTEYRNNCALSGDRD